MANDITSNYGALFGSRVQTQAQQPLVQNTQPAVLPQALPDSVRLTGAPQGAVSVSASPDLRDQMLDLRRQLMDVDRELQQMITQINAQPGQPAQTATVQSAQQPCQPAQNPGGTVRTQPGDYLWKIAKDQLGDANRWTEIYNLNRDTIGDNPNLLQPGQLLRLPGDAAAPQYQNAVPTNNVQATATLPANNLPANNQLPQLPAIQLNNGVNNQQPAGIVDVAVPQPTTQPSDQDALTMGREFGLLNPAAPITPDARANVATFMSELQSYQTTFRGQIYGPGMDGLATSPAESQAFKQSVAQIQQALNLLIQAGKLRPTLANGQPVQSLPVSGSFSKLDATGNPMKDAQGNPMTDEALVAAITQFKQSQGIHQGYRLADGTYAINEYVGPATVEALKNALLQLQGKTS